MRVALFSWETLHSIAVGGVGVHVTELAAGCSGAGTRSTSSPGRAPAKPLYDCIHGVHYHRCPFDLHPNFVDEINNMCRSFVHHFFARGGPRRPLRHRPRPRLAGLQRRRLDQGGPRPQGRADHALDGVRPQRQPLLRRPIAARPGPRTARHLLRRPRHHRVQPAQGRDQLAVPAARAQGRGGLQRRQRRAPSTTPSTPARSSAATPSGRSIRPCCSSAGWWCRRGRTSWCAPCRRCCGTIPNAKFVFAGDGHMQRRGLRAWPTSWASATPCACSATGAAGNCTTCSRRATSWPCPAATSRSASSSWKAGAPTSRSSAPSAAGRPSSSGTASTACRWTTRPIRWPGAWARCWPTTTAAAGWAATAGPPSTPPSAGTASPSRPKQVYASVA